MQGHSKKQRRGLPYQIATAIWTMLLLWSALAEMIPESAAAQGVNLENQSSADAEETPLPLPLPIERRRLANGLRVVLSPDRTVPTVAIAIYYDVGSRDEVPGREGFAHLFEHMMFKGSANVADGEHFSLITARGGRANATTSRDRTNYFQTLPSNELALGLWLEADRMQSLRVTAENFENQRQAVLEERRQRVDNQPYVPSWLRVEALAYGDYFPYAHSVIGARRDLETMPFEAALDFYNRFYGPNNAVVAIAGDFESRQAMDVLGTYFEEIEPRSRPERVEPTFTPQTEQRRSTNIDRFAELPALHLAYSIPPMRTETHYALELLALLLGDGESSRLYQTLVKDLELCTQISVYTYDRRGPDLFHIFGILSKTEHASATEEAIYREIRSIAEEGVSPRELQKAKNRVRSYFVFGLQSNLNRAQRLAEYEMYWGNAEELRTELQHYLQVSSAQIQDAAGRYFAATNRTVLSVLPTSSQAEAHGAKAPTATPEAVSMRGAQ
ncbi:MAG: pitrilysin family protein [Myxococcota bacterium]